MLDSRLKQNTKLRKTKDTIFGWPNLTLNIRDKVIIIINIPCNDHIRLTHGYLMAKKEKLKCNPCRPPDYRMTPIGIRIQHTQHSRCSTRT